MIIIKNESELAILRDFQNRVADLDQDETTCIRFLIAREFNLDLAEEMIRNNVRWRKDVNIGDFHLWKLATDMQEDFKYRFTGLSHNGGPVLHLPMGSWEAPKWIDRGRKDELILFSFHVLESVLNRIKNLDSNKQAVIIIGSEGHSYYKVANLETLKLMHGAFQTLEQNYPETIQNLIVLNAPWYFSIIFNFLKSIFPPKTLSKLQVFRSDRNKWLPALRELCPDDAIPHEYLNGL